MQRAIKQSLERSFVFRRAEHAGGVGAHNRIAVIEHMTRLIVAVLQTQTRERIQRSGADSRIDR